MLSIGTSADGHASNVMMRVRVVRRRRLSGDHLVLRFVLLLDWELSRRSHGVMSSMQLSIGSFSPLRWLSTIRRVSRVGTIGCDHRDVIAEGDAASSGRCCLCSSWRG